MAKAMKKEESSTPVILDQKDLSILRLLQQNARITVKDISDKVHLSTTPVYERIKWMEELFKTSNVISNVVPLADLVDQTIRDDAAKLASQNAK